MKQEVVLAFAAILFVILLVRLKVTDEGTLLVGCNNVAKTRGGTICLDKAYTR